MGNDNIGGNERAERARVLAWTKALTQEAGDIAVRLFHEGATVSKKADTTLVTNIDRAVETFVRDRIARDFPDDFVFGEEEGMDADRRSDAALWAVDPIDGTANMAHGNMIWCVSIGRIEQGIPTVGVVYAPLLGETHAAALGLGATRNDVLLPILGAGGTDGQGDSDGDGVPDKEELYACCSTSVRRVDFGTMPSRIRIPGSAALNLCWTADGRFVGGQGIGTDLYDVAAGIVIATEVGCEHRWLSTGALWSAEDMIASGRRPDALVSAPPQTLAYLLRTMSFVN